MFGLNTNDPVNYGYDGPQGRSHFGAGVATVLLLAAGIGVAFAVIRFIVDLLT